MTTVLVHGVPETSEVWTPLLTYLDEPDVVALRLPGFGTPIPDGFEAEMDPYAEWIRSELAAVDGPFHLVAHDWGALLALRVLSDRPANVRSWVIDAGDLDDDFTWHDMGKVWQTPGAGEEFIDGVLDATIEDRTALLVASGVPESGARGMAGNIDATMGSAILSLYRSAIDIGAEWGPGIDSISGPGMVIAAANDAYRSPGRAARLAERTGAVLAELPDQGHWWMLEDPEGSARRITDFWASM